MWALLVEQFNFGFVSNKAKGDAGLISLYIHQFLPNPGIPAVV
jgi:hypothetical protein